jgi:ATP/maltotriose-dependent transcriptional regulator MalT
VDGRVPHVPATSLAGRRAEIALLVARLDALSAGSSRVVEILGEPGIGKTRLLAELAARATDIGRTVLWGSATEFEHDVPFGVFADALDAHLASLDPARLEALDAESVALLPTAFPSMPSARSTSSAPNMMDAERYRLHRAVRDLLHALAGDGGLVLVLDDLHWADEASVELLGYLLRHPPAGPLLLAMACRPRQASAQLFRILTLGSQQGVVDVIEVAALDAADADELMPVSLGAPQRRKLYESSGGNPFYLQALARAANGSGILHQAGFDLDSEVPAAVRAVLLAELAALTPRELLAARAAAVAGGEFDAGLMAEIAELAPGEALVAVDRLAAMDLIRAAGVSGRFQYRHPLLRSVAYQSAGAGWRLAAHARAAAALGERGASAVERAHHVERSAAPGDVAAAGVLAEAASATMHTAPATAAHLAGAALRLLPHDAASTPQRLGLLGLRARALGVTGRLHDSHETLHEVLRLLPAEYAVERARTASFCATIEHLLGWHAEARALLRGELAAIGDGDSTAAATLMLGMLSGQMVLGDFTAQEEWIIAALDAARRSADPGLLAMVLGVCAVTSYTTGDINPRTVGWLDEAAGIVDALPDGDLAQHIEAAVWLGMAEVYLERLGDALRHLDRALRLARATGQNHLVSYLHVNRGTAHALVGDLRAASACFDDALEAALLNGSDDMQSMALGYQCWVTLWMGDVPRALRLGKEAVACAGPDSNWRSGMANGMYAQALLFNGDPATCVDVLVRAGGGPDLPRLDTVSRSTWYHLLAAADSTAGHPDRATDWADRAEAAAAPLGLPMRSAFAKLARAQALLTGDPAAALPHIDAAAEMFATIGVPVENGRCHVLAGVALGALGEVDRARDRFAQARTLFEGCGAQLFLDLAAREERRMNARMPRRSRQAAADDGGTDQLTRRERDVATLAAEGLSNRQIAEKLFLSSRTVELHLSRVFVKLGVSSRAALAALWARDDRS